MTERPPKPRSFHLSCLAYVHGAARDIFALAAELPGGTPAPPADLAAYRVSDRQIWELAAAAGERTLAACAETPDTVVYVTQNDPDTVGNAPRLMDRLGLDGVDYLVVSGHDCGNLGPALRLARDMVNSGEQDRVLLLLADRAHAPEQRLMASGLSVFSDGAAACLVTRGPLDTGGPSFRVEALASRTRVSPDATPDTGILATVQLARDSMAALQKHTGTTPEDYAHVVLPNYRPASQLFLTTALGFPHEKLLWGEVSAYAHCFSVDVLVTLAERYAQGALGPGSRVLGAAVGPYSWSTIGFTCR